MTLYWIVSLSYPFRFDGREPREVIRTDAPIPLTSVVPYAPAALNDLLLAMLEKDPARRPSGMEEVVSLLEACRTRPADPAEKAADRAFALCLLDEAMEGYSEALSRPPVPGAEPGRAERLLSAAREARSDLTLQLARIDERIAGDDLAGALLALGTAKRRFSRSSALKDRRRRMEESIRERFSSPRRFLETAVRGARFGEARAYLDRFASLISVPGGRTVLRVAGGEEAVFNLEALARQRASLDEREALHGKLHGAIEEAVQARDFSRARDALEELQNHFPLPQNLERMRAFSSAAEYAAFLEEYPLELVEAVARGESGPSPGKPLLLVRARERCLQLLSWFDPTAYPAFAPLEGLRDALERAIEALRVRARPELEAIREAHGREDLARARRGIDAVGDLVLRTEISPRTSGTRSETLPPTWSRWRSAPSASTRRDARGWRGASSTRPSRHSRRPSGWPAAPTGTLASSCGPAPRRPRGAGGCPRTSTRSTWPCRRGPRRCPRSRSTSSRPRSSSGSRRRRRGPRRWSARRGPSARRWTSPCHSAGLPPERKVEALRELGAAAGVVSPGFLRGVAGAAGGLPAKLAALTAEALGKGPRGEESFPQESPGGLQAVVGALALIGPLLAVPADAAGSPHAALLVAEEAAARARVPAGAAAIGLVTGEVANLLLDLERIAPPVADRIRAIPPGGRPLRVAEEGGGLGARPPLPHRAVRPARGDHRPGGGGGGGRLVRRGEEGERAAPRRGPPGPAPRPPLGLRRCRHPGGACDEETELALRIWGRDLPYFSALDSMADPDARFWARSVTGALVLGWITSERTPVLGRTGIRGTIEAVLEADLAAALEEWLAEGAEPFPAPELAGQAFPGVLARLQAADGVLAALADREGKAGPSAIAEVRLRAGGDDGGREGAEEGGGGGLRGGNRPLLRQAGRSGGDRRRLLAGLPGAARGGGGRGLAEDPRPGHRLRARPGRSGPPSARLRPPAAPAPASSRR